jgi:Recombination directionality factor-like
MPILDLQLRQRELGRIRIGRKAAGKGNPQKLDKFRFTSASGDLIEHIAALYGGTCEPWVNDGQSQFEVFTSVNRLPILVPPQPISQWYEMWSGGGCQRRCDGKKNILAGDAACACPADPLDRAELAAKGKACKPTTRLNVVLADIPGIGVWRLESHGYHSAVELPMVAEFLAQATEAGTYLPAELALMPRSSKRPGVGRREWLVPVIEVKTTPRALMAGDTGAIGGQRAAIGASRKAIEAPKPDYVALAEAAVDLDGWRAVWNQAADARDLDDQLKARLAPIGQKLRDAANSPVQAPAAADESGVVDAEIVESPEELDQLWVSIVENSNGMDYRQLEREFAARTNGLHPQSANAEQLRAFLAHLQHTVASGVVR